VEAADVAWRKGPSTRLLLKKHGLLRLLDLALGLHSMSHVRTPSPLMNHSNFSGGTKL